MTSPHGVANYVEMRLCQVARVLTGTFAVVEQGHEDMHLLNRKPHICGSAG